MRSSRRGLQFHGGPKNCPARRGPDVTAPAVRHPLVVASSSKFRSLRLRLATGSTMSDASVACAGFQHTRRLLQSTADQVGRQSRTPRTESAPWCNRRSSMDSQRPVLVDLLHIAHNKKRSGREWHICGSAVEDTNCCINAPQYRCQHRL